jgi:predicted transposase/invertase (TIGR01784 family)
MIEFADKYVNPFTDFGFKKIFGEEANKDLLKDFLNELLREEQGEIVDLTYLKTEYSGYTLADRRAVFDIYCENEKGEKFLVEMQKTKQKFFKERTLYYSSFLIQEQGKKNVWDFDLKAVYVIAILDFIFDEDNKYDDKYLYNVKLLDIETNLIFYDKLTFIYLEMPKFEKTLEEIETHFEKWLYLLKNLPTFDRMPEKLKDQIFQKVFITAEIANFTHEQMDYYEESLKIQRDLKNSLDTALEDGMKIGIKEGKQLGIKEGKQLGIKEGKQLGIKEGKQLGIKEGEKKEKLYIVKKAILMGLSNKEISELTGLSEDEIENIRR